MLRERSKFTKGWGCGVRWLVCKKYLLSIVKIGHVLINHEKFIFFYEHRVGRKNIFRKKSFDPAPPLVVNNHRSLSETATDS